MQEQFSTRGIVFERVDAVDASNIPADDILRSVQPEGAWMGSKSDRYVKSEANEVMVPSPILGRYITAGEVACYVSHMKALSEFVDSGLPYTCIFEDDVELDVDFAAVVKELAERVQYGIVKLEGLGLYDINVGRKVATACGRKVLFRFKPSTGAAAYFITRAAAKKLLASLAPIREPYDSWLRQYWRHQIPVYELSPFIARQAAHFGSSISCRSAQPQVRYARHALTMLKPIKFWYKTARVLRRFVFLAGMVRQAYRVG